MYYFKDYREPNQEDSDSSDPNQKEPAKQKKNKKQKKAPPRRWTDEEEVALCKAWLIWSQDPLVGNQQTRDGFYKKVTEEFHKIMNDETRSLDQIYSKWGDLNSAMKKWNGFYQQALMSRGSGEGEQQVLTRAMKNYKATVKSKGFDHMSAWDEVCYSPLWCDIPPPGHQSQPTSKRTKTNESMGSGNAQLHQDIQDDDEVDEVQYDRDGPRVYCEPERPARKGKRSAASSSSHEELIQKISDFNSFSKEEGEQRIRMREEKLRLMKEEKDARVELMRRQQAALDEQQKASDLEFLLKDHSIYQEPMLQLILDRKREIAARWG